MFSQQIPFRLAPLITVAAATSAFAGVVLSDVIVMIVRAAILSDGCTDLTFIAFAVATISDFMFYRFGKHRL